MRYTKSILGTRDFQRKFFRDNPEFVALNTNDPKDLTKYINEFHNDFIDMVVEERNGVELPLLMGKIMIVSYKPKRTHIDLRHYQLTGEKRKHLNYNTGGLACKVFYTNAIKRYNLKDKLVWEFRPSAKFSSKVSKAFKAQYHKYVHSVNNREIFYVHLTSRAQEKINKKIENFLENFDEFCIK